MDLVLEAHRLAKRYGRRSWALQAIDLAVPRGGITALVGPNAAGKSTLIRSWVGFERPTSGRVAVCGVDPWRDRSSALTRLGYVPQSPSLYEALSVDEHLELAALLRPGFDQAFASARLDELGIPLQARARSLSGGQQAQVALALALGTRAEVLLLDEPLATLDPLARREFLHVLGDAVRHSGATALLSSHIVSDVEQACDRLIVLGVGRVLLHDSVQAALASHRVVADGQQLFGQPVASFAGPSGELLRLVRAAGGGRAASLDELVMGYLASGRAAVRPVLLDEVAA